MLSFWKRWLLVYVWTDENGGFRILWRHKLHTTNIAHFCEECYRFENADFLSTCGRTKTEVFEYYDVINYILLTLRTFVRNAIVLKTLASCLRVDGRKRRFSNTMMSWIIYYWHYACFVSDAFVFTLFSFSRGRAKTIRIRCVWTRIFSETENKILLFQKYPDTCGQGLNLFFFCHFRCRRRRDCLSSL